MVYYRRRFERVDKNGDVGLVTVSPHMVSVTSETNPIRLYKHQEVALNLLRLNDSFALFMEQGTGKSFPVLFRIAELSAEHKIKSAAIVAPKAVCESWEKKIEQLSPAQQRSLKLVNLEIVSYDSIWRPKYGNKFWDCVVLDEAHYIKSYKAKRTKACLRKSIYASYRYILTGTPTSNGQLCNLYAETAFLFPYLSSRGVSSELFGGISYSAWLNKYAYLDQYFQPYKYHNIEEIQTALDTCSYRVKKADCLDLPDKLPDEVWYANLTDNKSMKLYKQLANDSASLEQNVYCDNPLTKQLRLRQIASGFCVNEDDETLEINNSKLNILMDYLTETESKTVVFCDFRHSIDRIADELDKRSIEYVVIDGRSKGDEHIAFQDDEDIKVAICQYQSGSAGIDLYAADTCIFFEPCRSSNLNEQAKDRIHRIGQTSKCSYYYILAKNTIDEAIYDALINYRDFSEKLFTEYLSTYTRGQKC